MPTNSEAKEITFRDCVQSEIVIPGQFRIQEHPVSCGNNSKNASTHSCQLLTTVAENTFFVIAVKLLQVRAVYAHISSKLLPSILPKKLLKAVCLLSTLSAKVYQLPVKEIMQYIFLPLGLIEKKKKHWTSQGQISLSSQRSQFPFQNTGNCRNTAFFLDPCKQPYAIS